MATKTNEQKVMDLVGRAEEAIGRATSHGGGGTEVRRLLHKLLDDATARWTPAATSSLVISLAKVHHASCKREKDDGPGAEMRLVYVCEDAATFRCQLCDDEVMFCLTFVVPGELKYKPAQRRKGRR